MSVEKSKKNIKTIVVIILIIAIIIGGVIATNLIMNNAKIKQTKEKISQINAQELQEKLINELKNTSLNVDTSSIQTQFGTKTITDSMDTALRFYYGLVMKNYSNVDGYVFAFVSSKDRNIGVAIPCFKIESDSNGNFQNIVFPSNTGSLIPIRKIMWETIQKVLEEEYNIDVSNFSGLGKGRSLISGKVNVITSTSDIDFAVTAFKEIIENTDGYSWSSNTENNIKSGEGFEISQEKFGIDTIDTKEQYIK